MTKRREHAVVLGAGLGGLLAARALVDGFSRVTVIDQDERTLLSTPRRGVPQGRHVHALLARGLHELESFFPGIRGDLIRRGAVSTNAADIPWLGPFGWYAPLSDPRREFDGVSMSRPLLEETVADRLLAHPRVSFTGSARAVGLRYDGVRVGGVSLLRDGCRGGLPADLVVDATGRGSHMSTWLADIGYGRPTETVVDTRLVYATRIVAAAPDALGRAPALVLQSRAGNISRGAVVARIEHGQWIVSFAVRGTEPPRTADEFAAFAEELPDSSVARLLASSTPLTDVAIHRGTGNRWRHFERQPSQPPGVLAVADAYCALNPAYGQGMTLAALHARALHDALDRTAENELPMRMYRQLARLAAPAWRMATAADVIAATPPEALSLGQKVQIGYLTRASRAACTSPTVRHAMISVAQLLRPSHSLLTPRVAAMTLLRGKRTIDPERYRPRDLPRTIASFTRPAAGHPPVGVADARGSEALQASA